MQPIKSFEQFVAEAVAAFNPIIDMWRPCTTSEQEYISNGYMSRCILDPGAVAFVVDRLKMKPVMGSGDPAMIVRNTSGPSRQIFFSDKTRAVIAWMDGEWMLYADSPSKVNRLIDTP